MSIQTVDSPGQNPYDDEIARTHSCYAGCRSSTLVRLLDPDRPLPPVAELIHDSFRGLVLSPRFSCLGARAAIRSGAYRIGVYQRMASPDATAGMARDLFTFVQELPLLEGPFSTFVACFTEPVVTDERHFEELLWAQLQHLHDLDARYHKWDPTVSADPRDPRFSFSFAGQAFFIVGIHAASSRWTRRFAWPSLVFNAHEQFEQLKQQGRFHRMQGVIRRRDTQLQGSTNPMLDNFGEKSEARQYAGRTVEPDWHCPFHTKQGSQDTDPELPGSRS